jgi:hypothetical protein
MPPRVTTGSRKAHGKRHSDASPLRDRPASLGSIMALLPCTARASVSECPDAGVINGKSNIKAAAAGRRPEERSIRHASPAEPLVKTSARRFAVAETEVQALYCAIGIEHLDALESLPRLTALP